jgi:hypothetical protein
MISNRLFNVLSLVILAVMAGMLILVITKAVPVSWYWPMFGVVLVLFLVRTTLRLILARHQRLEEERREAGENPPGPPPAGKVE